MSALRSGWTMALVSAGFLVLGQGVPVAAAGPHAIPRQTAPPIQVDLNRLVNEALQSIERDRSFQIAQSGDTVSPAGSGEAGRAASPEGQARPAEPPAAPSGPAPQASPDPAPAQAASPDDPADAAASRPEPAAPAPDAAAAAPLPAGPLRAVPYVLALFRSGEGVTIEGHMPSEADREALLAEARGVLSGLVVTDLTEVAEGVPAGVNWLAAGRFLVVQALRMRQGELRISGTELTVRAEPADRPGFVALNNALQAGRLPEGLRLAAADVASPRVSPYVWSVVRQGSTVLLRGYVPSLAEGEAARMLAAALFGGLAVQDEQVVAAGAPEGFAGAVAAALGHLALLEEGRAELSDRSLAIAGSAPSDVAAAAAGAAIVASAPFGYAVRHAIAAPPPPPPPPPPAPADTCSPRIAEVMAEGGIVFQFGRETMRPDSLQRLRRIADILKECPQVAFVVEGHTDSDGNPDQNRDLSERRAASVVSVLIRQGIAASRLSAEGLGQTRPLVPNDSAANKARNRRIEFRAVR